MQTTENQSKRIAFVDTTFQHPPKRIEQKKWADAILLMGMLFSIACLLPLIAAPVSSTSSTMMSTNNSTASGVTDDYAYISSYNSIPLFNQAAISPLMICVLPAMDVLIDLLPVNWFFFAERTVVDSKDMPDVVRLTAQERVLFIVGLLSMSEVVFPAVVNSGNQANIFFCFENVSTILTILPIISFLCRTSSAFTPLNSFLISLIVCIGSLISSCAITLPATSTNQITLLSTVVCGLMDTAAGLFFIICCISMTKYFMQARPRLSDNRIGWKDKEDINEQRFRTFVVASHMFTTLVELILNGVWYWYNGSPANQLGIFIYVMVATSTIVFVVELRIRKNEVTRALRALVGSVKKSYVRYISHELRTPLNCAFLGLKVLTTQYERSNNPKDRVNLEIIVDVNQSLNASLDILNDLLSLDKLENGMLDMNGQETSVLPFLRSAVEMFSVEARENEINLQFQHEPPIDYDHGKFGSLRGGIELPLRDSDVIILDRFKMNQVIRNLISNALKFTFRGGNIQVEAVFVPGGRITTSSSTNPAEASLLNREQRRQVMSVGYSILHHLFGFGPVEDSPGDVETGPSSSSVEQLKGSNQTSRHNHHRDTSGNVHGVLRIIVTDDGVGISAINQARLFHEVIQFSPERLQAGGGSGYGLCIAKGIVGIHEGFIGVFSPGEGKGSTFVVEIPMQRNSKMMTVNKDDMDDVNNNNGDDIGIMESSSSSSSPPVVVGIQKNNNNNNSNKNTSSSRVKMFTIEENLSSLYPATNNTTLTNEPPLPFSQHERRDSSGSSSSQNGGHRGSHENLSSSSSIVPITRVPTRPSSTSSSYNSEQSLLSSAYSKNGLHLLLVDDDAKSRKMMVRYFHRVGYRCDEADNGLRAVEKVEQKVNGRWNDPEAGYSVILMDFVMPLMDGPSATTVLRNKGYMGFIFGLTGNVSHKDKEYFMKHGLDRVFSKPLDTIEFEATIETLCSKSGYDFTLANSEKNSENDENSSFRGQYIEASKIILQQTSLSARPQPSIPSRDKVISALESGEEISPRKAILESTKTSYSLSTSSSPAPLLFHGSVIGGLSDAQRTSIAENHDTSTTIPPPAPAAEDAEDDFDASVPFVLPSSTKKAPRSGVLPRRFPRSNVRKPDKKNRSRDSPSFMETSTSIVEGKNPIALLKENRSQLKSALKSSKPLAQIDEDLETGNIRLESGSPSSEYGMALPSGGIIPSSSSSYQNSSFARPFPNRMCEMLIADDSHRNRRIMSQILQLAGYVCDTAYDGQMAVDKVRDRIRDGNARMYDVVLLDIIMPKMDGDIAAKEIRDLGFNGALIAMTGSTQPEDHNRFLQAGGNKVILKPLEIKELHSVILALLPKNRMAESDNAPPKLDKLTTTTNNTHHHPSSQQEGKEQRTFDDYKSVPFVPPVPPSSSVLVPSGQRIELLVVDDSRRNRRLMIKTMVLAGFVCEEADDGQNAVNMVSERIKLINSGKARMYDAIIMDIIMPTMDGDVAAKEIRDLGFDGALIAMTGSPAIEDHNRFLQAGGNKVLLKPLDMEELKTALYTIT